MNKRAFAVSAHPDDIEFMMAGTLLLLRDAGYEIHYMTVANGSCGTVEHGIDKIVEARGKEARNAANFAGAVYHGPLCNDIEVFYEESLLRRLAAIMREVAPEILLTHSPYEYMEDHSNTCRLALTAAFTRGMPNFQTTPDVEATEQQVTVYHALPYGLRDPLRRKVTAGLFVDVSSVMQTKSEMLSLHASQKEWLDRSQGLDSYLITMENMCREVGRMSERYEFAEGWVQHSHLGYCGESANPLVDALPETSFVVDQFERDLG